MNTPDKYHDLIKDWIDGDLDDEERAAMDAELQRHAHAHSPPDEEIQDVVGLLRSSGLMEKTAIHREIMLKWVDGELSSQESACFEAMMSADAELADDARAMRLLGENLKGSFSFDMEVPNPELFNRQIQEKIALVARG